MCSYSLPPRSLYLYKHELQYQTRMFVLRNFTDIALNSAELLVLPFDQFYEIISDDMLNSKDEEPVWECCLSWIDYDPNGRREYVRRLLEGVRLGLMNSKVEIFWANFTAIF